MPAHIVLFDGVCNLCNHSVQYIIKRDKESKIYYAPLQSDIGNKILTANHLSTKEFNTFIYVNEGKIYTKSDAALEVAKVLSWPTRLLHYLKIIPRFIRDGVYDFVSRNRYKWLGRRESCMIPTPELKSKFLS